MFMGQLTRAGFRAASPEAASELRAALARVPAVRLERFVEASLLESWRRALDAAPFERREHYNAAYWGGPPPTDFILADRALQGQLIFSINDPAFLRLVASAARVDPIGSFFGLVYRLTAAIGDRDRWHDDMDGNKLMALSLNLSPVPYAGGRLQVRDARTGATMYDEAHTAFGDAVLFRLSHDLKHRVSAVEPGPPRTVFTGWFQREPALKDWLVELAPGTTAPGTPAPRTYVR